MRLRRRRTAATWRAPSSHVRQELFLPAGLLLREHRADELRAAHAEIHAAVRDREPERARDCVRSHLEGTREMVAHALDELRREAATPS